MPSRDFCDRCDSVIKEGEPQFSLKTMNPVKEHPEYRSAKVVIGNEYRDASVTLQMLCKKCINEILQVVYKKPL